MLNRWACAGVLCLLLAAGGLEAECARRHPLSRLGRAVRRVVSLEPDLALRFSSWGIPEGGEPGREPDRRPPDRVSQPAQQRGRGQVQAKAPAPDGLPARSGDEAFERSF